MNTALLMCVAQQRIIIYIKSTSLYVPVKMSYNEVAEKARVRAISKVRVGKLGSKVYSSRFFFYFTQSTIIATQQEFDSARIKRIEMEKVSDKVA